MRRDAQRTEWIGLLADDRRHFFQVDQVVAQLPPQQRWTSCQTWANCGGLTRREKSRASTGPL